MRSLNEAKRKPSPARPVTAAKAAEAPGRPAPAKKAPAAATTPAKAPTKTSVQALVLPGSEVKVVDPCSIYRGYTGIVQRVSGQRAAVLFEGGNWDKLVTMWCSQLCPAPA